MAGLKLVQTDVKYAKQRRNTKQNCFSDSSASPQNNNRCFAKNGMGIRPKDGQSVLPLEVSCLDKAAGGKQNMLETLISDTFC